MLRIDRVKTEMDVLPSAASAPGSTAPASAETALSDPRGRERVKELVLEALRDHLQELQRQGTV